MFYFNLSEAKGGSKNGLGTSEIFSHEYTGTTSANSDIKTMSNN